MSMRMKVAAIALVLCLTCGAVTACGATASAQSGTSASTQVVTSGNLALHVVRTKPGISSPTLDTYVHDRTAITQLYTTAMKLPLAHGLYNCPAGDGTQYHLTFIGGALAGTQMDANASGCHFLYIGSTNDTHWMDQAFISLLAKTLGLPYLDPGFPNA